jgi:hypothetical protein
MPVKHSHLVRQSWIDVVGMGLAKTVPKKQIVLTDVPFATDSADAVRQP